MINILEIIMIISTFLFSYLILYCKRSSFVFGIISCGITAYILMASELYVQATLSLVNIIIYIHSFINWGKEKSYKIKNISGREFILSFIFIVPFTSIIGTVFDKLDGAYPYLDTFSVACSVTGVFLLGKKIIENSYIFIVANIVSIILCYITKDYITIITFVIYMIFNIIRIYTWNKIKEKEILNT